MTTTSSLTRTVTVHARAGEAQTLAEKLSRVAAIVAEAPDCELWHVHQDRNALGTLRVSEMCASRERCDAALDLPDMREHPTEIIALLDGPPDVTDGEPLAGVRVDRGETGATLFAILDAPDLPKDAELLGRYELAEIGDARYVREQPGGRQIGLMHHRLRPGRSPGWAHRHGLAEEIYVPGEGEMLASLPGHAR
jgi:quinol monooxygenase YgiN